MPEKVFTMQKIHPVYSNFTLTCNQEYLSNKANSWEGIYECFNTYLKGLGRPAKIHSQPGRTKFMSVYRSISFSVRFISN